MSAVNSLPPEDAPPTPAQRFDALAHLVREVVAVVDSDMVVTYVSRSAEAVMGWTVDHWIGHSAWSLVHPDDVGRAVEMARRAADKPDHAYEARFRLRHRDGEWRWMDAWGSDLLADPEVGGIVLTLRDVTEQRRTENLLRRLRTLVESTTDVVGIVERNGVASYLNQAGLELLGIRDADHLAEVRPQDVYTPESWAVIEGVAGPEATATGVWRGELEMRSLDGTILPVSQVMICDRGRDGRVKYFASVSRDIRDLRLMETQLRRQAEHDQMTGLPNRGRILRHLEEELALADADHQVAVIFFDLDRFKVINDSLGHQAGDRLLDEVARRIARDVRSGDFAGRFGGDEFVVVCPGIGSATEAALLADRIRAGVGGRFDLYGDEVHLSISVGVALSDGSASPEEILRDADAAMYEAKATGRDTVQVFDHRLRARAVERLTIEQDLRRALELDELRLAYQPIVDLATGELRALEALLRWDHPERGTLLPSAFLAVAEETGLIVQIGRWVLREACRQASGWPPLASTGRPPAVFVNVSARELLDRHLPAFIARETRQSGMAPLQLHLEITEQTIMTDVDLASRVVAAIRDRGVRFALDDFGTGHSSLAYLRQFPIGVVKIDQSFVHNLDDPITQGIIDGVIRIAHRVDTDTIAEGIETRSQQLYLTDIGCRWGQGNLFSLPLTARGTRDLVADGRLDIDPPPTY